MIQEHYGDDLRRNIEDNRTYNDVSYYERAPSYTDADYGTTHVAVLAKNGDAVSVTSTINYRFVQQKTMVLVVCWSTCVNAYPEFLIYSR